MPAVVFALATLGVGLLLALAGQYGFHRDELYFILAGRHPDFGYVDHPPLTPLVSAVAAWLLGVAPFAIRLVPALVAGAGVLLTADLARQVGGSRLSQALAALVVAVSGWLGAGHLDETTTYDIAFWTLTIWLLVPLLARLPEAPASRGRRLAIGLVMGFALENKTLAIALPAKVGASLLVLRRWGTRHSLAAPASLQYGATVPAMPLDR